MQIERFRDLSMSTACLIATLAGAAFYATAQTFLYLGFQPGWANGVPGVSQRTVFAIVMSVFCLAALLQLGIALTIVPCALIQRKTNCGYVGWSLLVFSTVAVVALSAFLVALGFYPLAHAAI
jgi:hypothetical protein